MRETFGSSYLRRGMMMTKQRDSAEKAIQSENMEIDDGLS